MFLGIDFGTTHSSMTVCDAASENAKVVQITPNFDEPYDTIMRTAAFIPEGTELEAQSLAQVEVHHLKFEKGKIGKRKGLLLNHFKPYFSRWTLKTTVQELVTQKSYNQHLEMERETQSLVRQVRNPPYARAEIVLAAAAVLARMKQCLPSVGTSVEKANHILLGNPVGFKGFSRNRLLQACVMSGIVPNAREAFRRIRFVYEPVAVACNVMKVGLKEQRGFVFDFGGGTLDLAVVRFEAVRGLLDPVEIESVRGLPVAGRHIDWDLLKYLLQQNPSAQAEYERRQATVGKAATLELLEMVESMKRRLSVQEVYTLPYGELPLRLTRRDLERILEPLLAKVRQIIRETLAAMPAGQTVDRVITAGGSSLIPAVQQELRQCFADQPKSPQFVFWNAQDDKRGGEVEKALLAVAQGLSLTGKRYSMRERTDRALYVLDAHDKMQEVMPRGQGFAHIGTEWLAEGPDMSLELPRCEGGVTLAIYEEGVVGAEYLVQLVDIPAVPGPVRCRCLWEKGTLLPRFLLNGQIYDPLALDDSRLSRLLSEDEMCLSFGGPTSPRLPCLRVGLGDEVECQTLNGKRQGLVIEIRHRDSWLTVPQSTPDLSSYLLQTLWQQGRTDRFEVRASNLTIKKPAERHRDTLQENLFVDQLRQELQGANG